MLEEAFAALIAPEVAAAAPRWIRLPGKQAWRGLGRAATDAAGAIR
jgi:hypothetical protein